MEWLLTLGAALCSFAGSYAAFGVHLVYLRRDIDLAHRRIDNLMRAKS